MISQSEHRATAATVLLLGILAIIILATFASLPMSWDEPDHQGYGRRILGWTMGLVGGEPDDSALTKGNLYLYGGAFDAPVEAVIHFLPFDPYALRHLCTAAVGLLGIAGCMVLGRQAGGPWVGLGAAALLALTPSWYGHMFWNPKDIPFATGVVWTLVLLARAAPRFTCLRAGESALLGATLGLTLGVRVGGVILLPLIAGVAMAAWLRAGKSAVALAATIRTLAIMGILAWGIMLLAWPYGQVAPLRHPLEAIVTASHFDWGLTVLFHCKEVPSDALPRSYLPTMLLVKLPEAVLILVAAGFAAMARGLFRRRLAMLAQPEGAATLLAVAMATLPVLAVVVMRPVLYDGIRHFLFILPPVMVVAALGAAAVWRRVRRAPTPARFVVLSLAVAWMVFQIITYIRLHPYQYIDYNILAGGLRGAAGRFETDYWGTSYREAVRHLDQSLTTEERARSEPWKVWTCSDPLLSSYYFPAHLAMASTPETADFFLATTRWDCADTVPGRVVSEVKRLDVTLAVIKDLRQ